MNARKEKASSCALVNAVPMPEWLRKAEEEQIGAILPDDEKKLEFTIRLAAENVRRGTGGPFAAAIFEKDSHRLVAAGINVVVPARQSWAHAEMTAFARAQNILGTHCLKGCILVTSCEPCAMCFGATPWSGVEKLVYGATREMAESVGFDEGSKVENWVAELRKRGIETVGPLLKELSLKPFALFQELSGKLY